MDSDPTVTGSAGMDCPASFASRLVEATREAAGRFEATLANPYWDATGKLDGVYCFKCANKLFPQRIAGGWVNEEDQPLHCGTCSAPLDFSLTDYGVAQMLEDIEENGIHNDEDEYGVHQMMNAGGNPLLTESCGEWDYRPEWKGRIQSIYEKLAGEKT